MTGTAHECGSSVPNAVSPTKSCEAIAAKVWEWRYFLVIAWPLMALIMAPFAYQLVPWPAIIRKRTLRGLHLYSPGALKQLGPRVQWGAQTSVKTFQCLFFLRGGKGKRPNQVLAQTWAVQRDLLCYRHESRGSMLMLAFVARPCRWPLDVSC